ncbi:DUF2778 domain-containing protein [Paraburkholderia sp. CNPSo 3157]|uniref:DUF2778 domain-containing protein n=1 Tax=Paraburkholderia franconis TaxID=2654983 RepID=A0A7X1TIE2_9BURK|nr:DUF2778 domain-containing protein [Paraburkholderia franconis]MPW20355.1 DUF2778 domain-containing protein [Paraburkholderia franconis]
MPVTCTFNLNRRPMSTLVCPGFGSIQAFSGNRNSIDNPDSVTLKESGPLPKGLYYIVDRESGGHLGWLWDAIKDAASDTRRSEWFALYRADGKLDDWTFINGVQRGNFRLHPVGLSGESKGCITLPSREEFKALRSYLKAQRPAFIPGTSVRYYGTVEVE